MQYSRERKKKRRRLVWRERRMILVVAYTLSQTSPVLTPHTLQDLPIICNKMCWTVRMNSKFPNLHRLSQHQTFVPSLLSMIYLIPWKICFHILNDWHKWSFVPLNLLIVFKWLSLSYSEDTRSSFIPQEEELLLLLVRKISWKESK